MLVVVDANVLISALITPGGAAGRVVLAGIAGRYDFALCPMLLAEPEDTSTRPRITNHVPFGLAEKLLADVRGAARTEPDPDVLPISRDPRDDYLVALASAVGADHLVTGDTDLLDIVEPPATITTLRTLRRDPGLVADTAPAPAKARPTRVCSKLCRRPPLPICVVTPTTSGQ